MRKSWFSHVAAVRKKEARKSQDKKCSHRRAMSLASESWPKAKLKLQRKAEREKRKAAKIKNVEPQELKSLAPK